MDNNHTLIRDIIMNYGLKNLPSRSMIGFEREALRVFNSQTSSREHPVLLGSALCNRYITIDFSESQLELITPPAIGNIKSYDSLNDIHHFVSASIGDEILWPLSMPPDPLIESEINIGNFGNSYEGIFKHIYRKGLAKRYGKSMQMISGLHFNYSFPNDLWVQVANQINKDLIEIKSEIYFKVLRNVYEMNWLLIYLFGSSPIISNELIRFDNDRFEKIDSDSSMLPDATSLRMSEYGYSNSERKKINVSLNSIEEYIRDLELATETIDQNYLEFENSQLSPNFLQIEAEYYAVARAKSAQSTNIRPTTSLKNRGIDFIEIRSIDLDPFSPIGISRETILFLEMFLIFCLLEENKEFDERYMRIINENDSIVAKYGRNQSLKLRNRKSIISIKSWGAMILDKMTRIAEEISDSENDYISVIEVMKSRLNNSEETLSAKIINETFSKKITQTEFGNTKGQKYKNAYLDLDKSGNNLWKILESERVSSQRKQSDLEEQTKKSVKSFEEFKEDYYRS